MGWLNISFSISYHVNTSYLTVIEHTFGGTYYLLKGKYVQGKPEEPGQSLGEHHKGVFDEEA